MAVRTSSVFARSTRRSTTNSCGLSPWIDGNTREPAATEPHDGRQVVERDPLVQVLLDEVAHRALLRRRQPARLRLAEGDVGVSPQDVHRELTGQRVDQQAAARPTEAASRAMNMPRRGCRVVGPDLVAQRDVRDVAVVHSRHVVASSSAVR